MCQHPAYQVNVLRKGVLCAPDSSNFLGHPVLLNLEHALITADLLNQNPKKKVMLLYKNCFN